MKTWISFLLFFFTISVTYAQKTINGKIKNENGDLVSSASVTVEEQGSDAIIAYGITNAKGEYKVSFSSSKEQVDIKIKAFNHKTIVKTIKNDNQILDFTIETQATEIKEVKLKTKLITKKGDTISYDLKAFDTKNDRTLADVMKRLPGVEVNKDGSILYQGQPLSKFYVNGKDLMEGGYGVINNSLPKDAVQKVEVLENHQPVKILQGKMGSDQAAINVKLKNKVTMTGRGEVGTGFGDPWLWNVKLTPMFFGQKNQWVVNYKTNNVGETVESEGNMFAMGNRWEGRRANAAQNDWLNVENAAIPNLPERRYLLNNVHFLSANLLTNPFKSKEWELKANASYTNNDVERESYTKDENFQLNNTFETRILNHFYTNKAKGEVIFTKNAKKGFFKNTTSFTQFWNADRADVNRLVNNVDRNAQQALESPTSSFQNSLSTIIPWKEKMVNLMSFISYQNDRQTLSLTPASYLTNISFNTFNTITQQLKQKTFEANHSANISFTKKFWTITPEIGLNYTNKQLNSDLFADQTNFGKNTVNNLQMNNLTPFAAVRLNYKTESWNLFSNFPVNFNAISVEDAERNVNKKVNKITFEPNIFAQYSFASFWKAMFGGGLNYSFGDLQDAYAGVIMMSPSSFGFIDAKNPLPENFSKNGFSRIEYRNPLNNLFFNIAYNINHNTSNIIANPTIDNFGLVNMNYLLMDNSRMSKIARAEVGKYFPKFKTNLSTSFSNNDITFQQMQNNTLVDNESNSQNLGLKLNNSYFSWINFDYSLTYNRSKQKNSFNTTPSKGFNHNLSVFVYPAENHTVGFYWDQINTAINNEQFNNAFYDLSYQYAWTKKKIDFEIKWMNIANKNIFERASVNTFSNSFTRINIRPSQVMFTVKFNFK